MGLPRKHNQFTNYRRSPHDLLHHSVLQRVTQQTHEFGDTISQYGNLEISIFVSPC